MLVLHHLDCVSINLCLIDNPPNNCSCQGEAIVNFAKLNKEVKRYDGIYNSHRPRRNAY